MFFLRLNKIKFTNARDGRRFVFFGKPNKAEVKIMSFVTTEHTVMPDLDNVILENNPDKQQSLIKEAVATVVNNCIFTTVDNVEAGKAMTFGTEGYSIYTSEKIPEYFNWQLLVIDSDRKIRNNANLIDEVLKHSDFNEFSNHLVSTIRNVTSPGFEVAVNIGKFITQIVVEKSKNNEDDQLGVLYESLNRQQHYLHGERKRDDVRDVSGNMFVDYSLFGF